MDSTFADRLFWARNRKGMGATVLSRQVGCSQSLISFIERTNSDDPGQFGKGFADALDVSVDWLVRGDLHAAPAGFTPELGRKARDKKDKQIVLRASTAVRGAAKPETHPSPPTLAPVDKSTFTLESLAQSIIHDVLHYRRLAGAESTKGLLIAIQHIANLNESSQGQKKMNPVEGNTTS